MPELVRAQPAFKTTFTTSLGLDVLSSMGLVCIVHEFEGLSEWVVETAASLPLRLRHDIQLSLRVGKFPTLTLEALAGKLLYGADEPAHEDLGALLSGLAQLSAADCAAMQLHILTRAAEREEIQLARPMAEIITDQEQLEVFLAELGGPLAPAEVISLIQEPLEWRDLLISTVQRFWDRVYHQEYLRQYPQRERNVQYHRGHPYSANFNDVFTAVTGRLMPDHIRPRLQNIQEVRFVPSPYIGPYLSFLFNTPLLTVIYNSRVTPAEGDEQAERTQSLYQPLAALADKTRLQIMSLLKGRELYAQEIVNLLDIHQSAVSRHLKLMETAGVLVVRRDKGSKFYSINRQRIQELSTLLRDLA